MVRGESNFEVDISPEKAYKKSEGWLTKVVVLLFPDAAERFRKQRR